VLAAVVLHQRAVESEGGRQLLARAASAACFGLGLLTKSVAITTPALLLLLDVVRRRRCRPLRPVTYAPYALLGAMYLFVIRAHLDEAVVSEPVRGLADQLTTQAKALAYYAKLLVFPIGLNVYHQFFEAGLVSVILAASLLVPTLAWLALRDRSRTGLLSVGWVGVTLAPTAVVPLHVLVNDHRLYLPLVGAVMGLVAVLGAKPLQGRRRRLVAALALLGLAATTMQRNRVWEDEFTLWSDAAAKSPHPLVPTAHIHLGNYAKDHGSLDVAIAEYQRALEISPGHVAARTNLGLVYEAMGDVDRAIDNYRSLLADDPEVDEAWHNLGNSLRLKASTLREAREPSAAGFFAQAREAYGNVSEDSYHYQLALNNIGTVLEVEGRPDSAVWYYRQALAVSVHTEDARINLDRFLVELPVHAPMLLESGRGEVAEGLCEQLLIAKPDHRASLFFLAVSRFEQGRYPESLSPNQRLVEVHPDFEAGYLQLANLYETLGNAGAASDVYRRHVDRFSTGELTEEARKRWQRLRQRNGR
jgi:tetratricopeptide (TPR) repeat protein